MSVILAIVVIAVVARLWNQILELKGRIAVLEDIAFAPSNAAGQSALVRPADLPVDRPAASPAPSTSPLSSPGTAAMREIPDLPRRPEPSFHPEPSEERPPRRPFGLEDLFGRMLPIWAGGLTLAIAGLLVIKWSIDAGVLSPSVRVVLGALFGIGLIAGAEISRRMDVADGRIPQALSGAGVASLYGAILLAHLMYGLVDQPMALAGMVATTVVAGWLSMRFGPASAVLGLVGGLLAPALVGGGEPRIVLVSAYIAFVTGGVGLLARLQGRAWLAGAAMAGGLMWSAALGMSASNPVQSSALGLLVLFLSFLVPAMAPEGRTGVSLRVAGAAIGALQTAALVAMGGFGTVQWSMLGLATAMILWISQEDDAFSELPSGILLATLVAASAWRHASPSGMAAVLVVIPLMHVVHAVLRLTVLEHARLSDSIRLVVIPGACCTVASLVFPAAGDWSSALLWTIGAGLTAAASAFVLLRGDDSVARAAQPAALLMAAGALWLVAPHHALPLVFAAAAAVLLWTPGWRTGSAAAAMLSGVFSGEPFMRWFVAVAPAPTGIPVLPATLPSLWSLAWGVMPVLSACVILALSSRMPRDGRRIAAGMAVAAGLVLVHTTFRRTMGISTPDLYRDWGMLDRTLWEMLLAGAAFASFRLDRRIAAFVGLASLVHFAWFTLLVMNPLWRMQWAGPAPVINLILLSHAVAFGLLWGAGRLGLDTIGERCRSVCQMLLAASLAFSLLREAAVGSYPAVETLSQGEDIARSVVGLLLAIGFLVHGMWRLRIEWRVGSLLMMLAVIGKVFLFDASGLDGLARVVSFAALGFSLIGVGWLYSRLLRTSNGI